MQVPCEKATDAIAKLYACMRMHEHECAYDLSLVIYATAKCHLLTSKKLPDKRIIWTHANMHEISISPNNSENAFHNLQYASNTVCKRFLGLTWAHLKTTVNEHVLDPSSSPMLAGREAPGPNSSRSRSMVCWPSFSARPHLCDESRSNMSDAIQLLI